MSLSDKIKNAKCGTSLFEEIPPERMYALKIRARIASAIVNERKRRGMSQSDFAQFCGVSQPMISKWESGEYNFTIEAWAELSSKLSLPFDPKTARHTSSVSTLHTNNNSSISDANIYISAENNVYDFAQAYQIYQAHKEN